jgi:hypothetical protein
VSGAEVAIQVVRGIVEAAPDVAELIASIAGTSPAELSARLDRAEAAIREPIDPSVDDAARRARLDRILRGERPIGERETPTAPQPPDSPFEDA